MEADSSESDDEEDELQKFLEGEDIDTDENDESFKVNTSGEARYEKKYILTKIIYSMYNMYVLHLTILHQNFLN